MKTFQTYFKGVEEGFSFPHARLIPLTPKIGAGVAGSKLDCDSRGRGSNPLRLTKFKDDGILADGRGPFFLAEGAHGIYRLRGHVYWRERRRGIIEHSFKRQINTEQGKYVGPGVVGKFLIQAAQD